ncbi:MAG: sulfite exporter TauE/SafE family protein [Pseudomonadota bacterium]
MRFSLGSRFQWLLAIENAGTDQTMTGPETAFAPWQYGLLSAVGVVAGWMNVMAGGGSLLTIPAMLFMGVSGPVANGTNRIAIAAQNIVASITFFRSGISDLKLSLTLAAAASIGAAGGAAVGTQLDGVWFNRLLALVMVGVMVLMATGSSGAGPATDKARAAISRQRLWAGHLCMVGAGAWGGFIQIGVGFILMPILHRVLGLDLVRTNAHKVLIVLIYTVIALAVFSSQVELLWAAGLALAVGNAVGGWLGARTSIDRGEGWIKGALYVGLSALVIKLLFFP